MERITMSYKEDTREEARNLFEEYKDAIIESRRNKHMTGRAGESHILRLATEIGMPFVAEFLSQMAKN